jgi:UDP-N-acetylglucosamine--N-acetylmuramyl-(pentapeptide) pyrophosphoryl-undecaprenol N-acetylglucosamine transferase
LLAVLRALEARAPVEALWLGSERIESQLLPRFGVPFEQIDIRFSWRRPTPSNWGYYIRYLLPLVLGRPFRQARAVVQRFQPQLVFAAGGYVAAPALWAAQELGIPSALLQIDNPPGLVNWHYAPGAARVYCAGQAIVSAFTGRCSPSKLVAAGYPALPALRSKQQVFSDYGIEPGRKLLLCMGGSLGAGAIHRLVAQLLLATAGSTDLHWSHLALLNVGGERPELMARHLPTTRLGPESPIQYVQVDYLEDASGALCAADFYLGRSGAATVGELLAAGLHCLLIPDPQHGDRQQFGNAEALVERGQAEIQGQAEATALSVADWLARVWNAPRIAAPVPPAAEVIAADLLGLLEGQV